MSVNQTNSKSPYSAGCFYAAGYLCLAAVFLIGYQFLVWYRGGAWIPYHMWLILESTGWQHAPSVPVGRAQATLDWVWDLIGNCPITLALCAAALSAVGIGVIWEIASTRAAELKDAH